MIPLPPEILIKILSNLSGNKHRLFQCSLVNKAFNHAASQLLYSKVLYSPVFRAILDLKDKGDIPERSQLRAACLPHNSGFVQELVVKGYLCTKSISLSTFSQAIARSVRSFYNLTSIQLTPPNYHDHVFVALFEALLSLNNDPQLSKSTPELSTKWRFPPLQRIVVNHSCTDENTAPLLIQLVQVASPQLGSLTIESPTRAILNLLPECLAGSAQVGGIDDTRIVPFPSLCALHLKDNCGSITPGVLSAIATPSYLRSNLRELTLGLSYSLTHDDIFRALSFLSRLEKLQLHYYLQIKPFTTRPALIHLTSFTAIHEPIRTPSEAKAFCKWARTVIDHAPLRIFRLVGDKAEEDDVNDPSDSSLSVSGAGSGESDEEEDSPVGISGPAYDGLVQHLIAKHASKLRELDIRHAYVGVKAARQLVKACKGLRVLRFAIRIEFARAFCNFANELTSLREVEFEIRNRRPTRKAKLANEELVKGLLIEGSRTLQVIWLDGVRYRRKPSLSLNRP